MNHPMTRAVMLAGIAWLAAVWDMGIGPLTVVWQAAPQACLLAAALSIALSESPYAFLLAGGFGLTADLAGGGSLGVCLAAYALSGYCILRLRGAGRSRGIARQTGELVGCVLLMSALPPLLELCLSGNTAGIGTVYVHAAGVGILTGAIALPVLLIVASTRSALRAQFTTSHA